MGTVLQKDCRASRRVGLGASVWMSKIVLDFVYIEQHEMQIQTFDHRKAKCCVSKANPPWNFAKKLKQSWVLNVQGKLRKKRPPLRLCLQRNFLDFASAKNMRSPSPRSPNSAFCPPLIDMSAFRSRVSFMSKWNPRSLQQTNLLRWTKKLIQNSLL